MTHHVLCKILHCDCIINTRQVINDQIIRERINGLSIRKYCSAKVKKKNLTKQVNKHNDAESGTHLNIQLLQIVAMVTFWRPGLT